MIFIALIVLCFVGASQSQHYYSATRWNPTPRPSPRPTIKPGSPTGRPTARPTPRPTPLPTPSSRPTTRPTTLPTSPTTFPTASDFPAKCLPGDNGIWGLPADYADLTFCRKWCDARPLNVVCSLSKITEPEAQVLGTYVPVNRESENNNFSVMSTIAVVGALLILILLAWRFGIHNKNGYVRVVTLPYGSNGERDVKTCPDAESLSLNAAALEVEGEQTVEVSRRSLWFPIVATFLLGLLCGFVMFALMTGRR